MTPEQLFHAIGQAEDDLLESSENHRPQRWRPWRRWAAMAAAACLLLAIGLGVGISLPRPGMDFPTDWPAAVPPVLPLWKTRTRGQARAAVWPLWLWIGTPAAAPGREKPSGPTIPPSWSPGPLD